MSRIRFMDNDYSDFAAISATGSVSGFSYTNAANTRRSRVWKPAGTFIVTASNNLIYINDGSDKTVTLTAGTYTYSTLATHIQTQLNASSSGWTCTYDFSGGTFRFTIARSSSGTLRFTQTTTAAWDMLGYTLSADTAGTSFPAQEQRNHTMERYVWAMPVAVTPTFFAAIGPISSTFGLSDTATASLKANGMPVWDSPSLTISLDHRDSGIMRFLEDQNDITYNYFCYEFIDRTNPCGPEGFSIGRLFLGDYTTVTTTDVAGGFGLGLEDPSDVVEAENGGRFTNERPQYRTFNGLEIQNMTAAERLELQAMFGRLGVGTPFFVSFDSDLDISTDLDELTFYAHFESKPDLAHLIRDTYTMAFALKEAC